MPLYEYLCDKCGYTFEVIQKFSDKPIKKCEKCNGKVTKLISPPGLSFKGSGWYITDYSSKSKPPDSEKPTKTSKENSDTKKEKETSQSTTNASSPSTDTKTQAPTPSKTSTPAEPKASSNTKP